MRLSTEALPQSAIASPLISEPAVKRPSDTANESVSTVKMRSVKKHLPYSAKISSQRDLFHAMEVESTSQSARGEIKFGIQVDGTLSHSAALPLPVDLSAQTKAGNPQVEDVSTVTTARRDPGRADRPGKP